MNTFHYTIQEKIGNSWHDIPIHMNHHMKTEDFDYSVGKNFFPDFEEALEHLWGMTRLKGETYRIIKRDVTIIQDVAWEYSF